MRPLAALLAATLTGPDGLHAWPEDVVHVAQVEPPDAGVAIWQRCEEQFRPDAADVAKVLDGGYVLLSPSRAAYDGCRVGAGAKCSELLEHADAGTVAPAESNLKFYLWVVTSLICATSAGYAAYANNRTARHLGLWP